MDGRILAQLASSPKLHDVEHYLTVDDWAVQQKLDGHRLLLKKTETTITGLNRTGAVKNTPPTLVATMEALPNGLWIFDGEVVGETYYVFDILQMPNLNMRSHSWLRRQGLLQRIFEEDMPYFELVPYYQGADKRTLYQAVRDRLGEGVVFKNTKGHYVPGRGNDWVKVKFVKEVDCEVYAVGIDGKDNLGLQIYRDGEPVSVGKVSALQGDGPDCQVGDVVKVTVLSVSSSGKLIQPTIPRLRDDKRPEQCTWDQLDHVANTNVVVEMESK